MSTGVSDADDQRSLSFWIDTHVHWDAPEFDADRSMALQRARAVGVVACLNPAVSVGGFDRVRTLAETSMQQATWPRVLPAYGIHPLYVDTVTSSDLTTLDQYLSAHRPVAIGEIGLDAYVGAPDMTQQQTIFEAQLALAVHHQLPVLLHVRHAVEAVIQSLKRIQGAKNMLPGGIAHAFNGSESQADQLMRMGFLLGFGGSLSYEGSRRIRRLASSLPLSHIVLETDAPDMSPMWLHQARNESAELPKIGVTLAKLRDIDSRFLSEQTTDNARRLIPALA